ncbi:DUF1801 domain-containing protein [Thalassotalea mangrovi]|uniref:DUF1801 domain-containing protein n=1 Tax=Thalassotalea mangrovi TaxID=2572245 RepID=A0A4U1B2I1_9GAMM|nr:DUF1801 domain-containing protein [Thalassotalea mangrovi]TKB43852.1 DUF1801 domain-containing protein [Thalassotalea mangrovi]
MSENKTQLTDLNPDTFIAAIEHPVKRQDSEQLLQLFSSITKQKPQLWGTSIIGFGQYHYRYESGREGDFLRTGFAPRKQNIAIYIMPGFAPYQPLLNKLGKHKIGKSCLYINKLADIDMTILTRLIETAYLDMNEKYPI